MAKDRMQQIRNILRDVGEGFKADYELGREDRRNAYLRGRKLKGETEESTRWQAMMGTHPGIYRMKEAAGNISPQDKQALREHNMDLRGSTAHKTGQFLGSAANDLTQDATRSIYWLLNAAQATGEVINESVLAKAVPQLYEKSLVQSIDTPYKKIPGGKEKRILNIKDRQMREEMLNRGYAKNIMQGGEEKLTASRGYSFDDVGDLQKRNYTPGMVQALAIPTGVAINSGLGLLTPFGGYEGYKAALPSEEDPTKTSNVVGEVALKYMMGKTGNLLPYNEFVKVRPDVSRDEYNAYQAFKYDKSEDYNPLDGDFSIGGGALRGTSDGIHGAELQFLGRSLPATTAGIPYATALAGTVAGAMAGRGRGKAAIGGLVGGMGGVSAGIGAGNIIEQERRRRNAEENLSEGGNAEMYLG
jgi:hypothetical protein